MFSFPVLRLSTHRLSVLAVGLMLFVSLTACGPSQITTYPTQDNTGSVNQDGSVVRTISQNSMISIGDDAPNRGIRGFLSFDLSRLPDDATIEGATLYLPISTVGTSGDLFTNLGELKIQQFYYESLDASDFTGSGDFPSPPPDPFFATIKRGDVETGLITDVTVKKALEYHQANRSELGESLQFRMYATVDSNDDNESDTIGILGGPAVQPDTMPRIVISYTTSTP